MEQVFYYIGDFFSAKRKVSGSYARKVAVGFVKYFLRRKEQGEYHKIAVIRPGPIQLRKGFLVSK